MISQPAYSPPVRNSAPPFPAATCLRRMRLGWLVLTLFLAAVLPVSAHLPSMAAAQVAIESDGKFTLDLTFDVPPFVLDVTPQAATDTAMNTWLDGPTSALAKSLEAAQSRFQTEFTVVTDQGTTSVEKIIFPTVADLERYKESVSFVQLPVMLMLSLEGHLPAETRSVSFHFPAVMGVVSVTVNRPGQTPVALVANSGEATRPLVGGPPISRPRFWPYIAGRHGSYSVCARIISAELPPQAAAMAGDGLHRGAFHHAGAGDVRRVSAAFGGG